MDLLHTNYLILHNFKIDKVKAVLNTPVLEISLEKYGYIMDNVLYTNVQYDEKFREVFSSFYRLKEAKDINLIDCMFYFLETNKNNKYTSFEEVIDILYKATGKVHSSFASKLLATINPDLPVLDKYIRINLEIPQFYGYRNVEKTIEQYYQVINLYKKILLTPQAKVWIQLFDEKFQDNKITDIKKLDLILWQIR